MHHRTDRFHQSWNTGRYEKQFNGSTMSNRSNDRSHQERTLYQGAKSRFNLNQPLDVITEFTHFSSQVSSSLKHRFHVSIFIDWLTTHGFTRYGGNRYCSCHSFILSFGRKEMLYLSTHSTHFIYGNIASDIW